MNKRFLIWSSPAQAIVTLMLVLLAMGCVNILSASFVDEAAPYNFFVKYIGFAILGFAAIIGIRSIGYARLLSVPWLRYVALFGTMGLLLWTDVSGVNVKGAVRWVNIFGIRFQPSELAKVAVIFLATYYLGRAHERGRQISVFNLEPHVMKLLVPSLFFSLLVLKQPDMGTAAIIIALAFGMLVIAGLLLKELCILFAIGSAAVVVFVKMAAYRMDRILAWMDPWAYAQDKGYQTVQSLLAIGSGGLTGMRWGEGAGKYAYLPEAHTDFAFAIFCQENGFLGVLFLVLIFSLLAAAFFVIIRNARDFQGFLLASGVTFLIIGQALGNMAMVCGMLPVIGVPMVFISYGGTSMVVSMAAIGLLLSVYDAEVHPERLDVGSPDVRRSNLRMMRTDRRSEQ